MEDKTVNTSSTLDTLEEIKADILAVQALGASELFFDATFSPGVRTESDFLRILEEIRRMI